MERFLRVLGREWVELHEAAFLLAGAALCSQALGLVRDRMLAHRYGAGIELDTYYAAFRIPDFLYASVASFVAVTVLIPFILERINGEGGREATRRLISHVFTAFALIMLICCAIAYLALPTLAHYVVPGFGALEREQFVELSRMLLLSPLLLGISNLFGSITQSFRRFVVFAVGPVLYNLGIIIGITVFQPHIGMRGVVLGVILGALLHVLIQLPVLISERMLPRFVFPIDFKTLLRIATISLPRTLALSAMHLSTMVLLAMASQIGTGAIAVFILALNLQSIPLAIVGMSYSVAAFPALTRLWQEGDRLAFLNQIATATRHIFFWSFPAIVLFIVLRAQIVRSVLGSGNFDWTATRLTAALLALFALSVVAQNLVLLYTRASYAMSKTKDALIANTVGAVLVLCFAVLLTKLFDMSVTTRFFVESLLRVEDIQGTHVLMLALGYSLGVMANLILLARALRREFPHLWDNVRHAFFHSGSASIVMGFVAYHSLQVFAKVFDLNSFIGIFSQGLFAGISGIVAGVYLLHLMQSRELAEIWASLHHKFWKSKPIASEQEGL